MSFFLRERHSCTTNAEYSVFAPVHLWFGLGISPQIEALHLVNTSPCYITRPEVTCPINRLIHLLGSEFCDAGDLQYYTKSENQKSVLFTITQSMKEVLHIFSLSHFKGKKP